MEPVSSVQLVFQQVPDGRGKLPTVPKWVPLRISQRDVDLVYRSGLVVTEDGSGGILCVTAAV